MKKDMSTGTVKTPSLSRKIESLMLFFLGITENVPRIAGIDILFSRVFEELLECQTASILAYNTIDDNNKITLLENISERMLIIGSITKCIFEWSSRNKQCIRLISEKKHAEYLTIFHDIIDQNGKWTNSIKSKLQKT